MSSSSFNTTNTEASNDSNNDTLSDDASGDEEDDKVLVEQDKQESSTTKLLPYHAKNYLNSTMGRKDLRVLFAMAIGCTTHDLPDHKDPLFSKAKTYHSEVRPDAATLKLEVTRRWKAYFFICRQPRPSNWKIDKCTDYLMSRPIPTSEAADLDFLESELKEWTGIQEMVNESYEKEEDRIINRSWSSDIPYLPLYHTLVDDTIRSAFGKAYCSKTHDELDGRNSSLFQDFYELSSARFNNVDWIPNSLVLPELHEDFSKSKPLPLNVTPISAEQFKKKLNDNRYKMVKVISDWERSGAGAGMVNNIVDDSNDEPAEYEFLDGDDHKSFLRERPPHILYLWHLSHKYGILKTVRQQLDGHAVVDGTSAPNVDVSTKKESIHQIQVTLHIVKVESSRKTWST